MQLPILQTPAGLWFQFCLPQADMEPVPRHALGHGTLLGGGHYIPRWGRSPCGELLLRDLILRDRPGVELHAGVWKISPSPLLLPIVSWRETCRWWGKYSQPSSWKTEWTVQPARQWTSSQVTAVCALPCLWSHLRPVVEENMWPLHFLVVRHGDVSGRQDLPSQCLFMCVQGTLLIPAPSSL